MLKYVYDFQEGNREMKDLLGGKGANLAEMTRMGLTVPHGFTVTCEACNAYRSAGRQFPEGMLDEVAVHLEKLEEAMGRRLGDPADPLLVSVRSGAPFSMPGMMDTVLNVGLNDDSVKGLEKQTGDERFAWDSYRRLVQMFGKNVMGGDGDLFEEAIDEAKDRKGVETDVELGTKDLKALVKSFKKIVKKEATREFPMDPTEQLHLAIDAVFKSWDNKRAQDYRRRNKIDDSLGTAVNVQAMVFGNKGDDSGTGVAFTRDPSTGEKNPVARGLNASPGAAVGRVVFTSEDALARADRGENVILVRRETNPDDYHGMVASQGILTSAGGTNSHARVVARGEGIPGVCGADAIRIDRKAKRFSVAKTTVEEGDWITIDGTDGTVYAEKLKTEPSVLDLAQKAEAKK